MSTRRFVAVLLASLLIVTGCGGAELQKASGERDACQSEVATLQEKVKSLEAEVAALKEAPQELLKQAVEARGTGAFEKSGQLLDTVEQKYPASAEAAKVPGERDKLKQAVAAKKEADRKAYEEAVAKAQGEPAPDKAKAILNGYLSQNPTTAFKAEVDKRLAAYDEQIRLAAEEAKKPPVEIVSATMTKNSIGTPEMNLSVRNASKKVIDGFEFSVDLYDNYDRPVYHYRIQSDGNTYNGIAQHEVRQGGTGHWSWTMHGFDLATKYRNLRVRSVHFTDGSSWRP